MRPPHRLSPIARYPRPHAPARLRYALANAGHDTRRKPPIDLADHALQAAERCAIQGLLEVGGLRGEDVKPISKSRGYRSLTPIMRDRSEGTFGMSRQLGALSSAAAALKHRCTLIL